jgi:hypothetical protein
MIFVPSAFSKKTSPSMPPALEGRRSDFRGDVRDRKRSAAAPSAGYSAGARRPGFAAARGSERAWRAMREPAAERWGDAERSPLWAITGKKPT